MQLRTDDEVKMLQEVMVVGILREQFNIPTGQIARLLELNPRSVLRRLEKFHDTASDELCDALQEEGLDNLAECTEDQDGDISFIYRVDEDGGIYEVMLRADDNDDFAIDFTTISESRLLSKTEPVASKQPKVKSKVELTTPLVPFKAIILPSVLVVVRDGKPINIDKKHKFFAQIHDLIKAHAKNEQIPQNIQDDIFDLIDLKTSLESLTDGKVKVVDNIVYVEGVKLDGRLADRLVDAVVNGTKGSNHSLKGLANFLVKIQKNPSFRVVSRVYDFLKANDIEINDDGDIVTLKVVNKNYTDKYTGTMDNSPGKTVRIPRNAVDDNDDNTCSNGLHVCSLKYFIDGPYFKRGDTVVECIVDPADWVSVPTDYDNSKARVCGYFVSKDITAKVDKMIADYKEGKRGD